MYLSSGLKKIDDELPVSFPYVKGLEVLLYPHKLKTNRKINNFPLRSRRKTRSQGKPLPREFECHRSRHRELKLTGVETHKLKPLRKPAETRVWERKPEMHQLKLLDVHSGLTLRAKNSRGNPS